MHDLNENLLMYRNNFFYKVKFQNFQFPVFHEKIKLLQREIKRSKIVHGVTESPNLPKNHNKLVIICFE